MSSKKSDNNKLPDGWVLCQSKSIPGRKYFFNKKTGKSSWSQPQADDKSGRMTCKKEKLRRQERKRREELAKKAAKRKSDVNDGSDSRKRTKGASDAGCSSRGRLKESPHHHRRRKESSQPSHSTPKTTPSKCTLSNSVSPQKHSSSKNTANTRLSNLRAKLAAEVREEDLNLKKKVSPKTNNETPQKSQRSEQKSPSLNDSKSTQSPSSDSSQSMPSPSQFFAANKIISSMKAQLPEEYCNKEKQKDTFADIEKGICSQTTEYPFSKHPATPPQFSEASKLVSAIKSKLAYKGSSSKEGLKTFPSANARLEVLRANLSMEAEQEMGDSFLSKSNDSEQRDISEAMEVEEIKEAKHNETFLRDSTSGDDLVLVIDTNIFIHDLDFIKVVLNSHIKGYSEQPTVLVPWRVINELDRLKDNNNGNGSLCKRAKAAMDYLYKSLPENSRIKGQSLRDANSHIYPCEVPDDEILNCSLQQLERDKNVILLTNDKNLCNKASINNVKHSNVSELQKLVENKPQPQTSDLRATVKRYTEGVYHLLANILENEMRAKYNELWQHVVFKPPPWSLDDVLQCLLKHWIAVFNEVFPRIEHLLADLRTSLITIEKKEPSTLTQSEVSTFKELCVDVTRRCQIIPEYMELAKTTLAQLTRDGIAPDTVDAFEALWTVLSSYCAKLASALGVSHCIEDSVGGEEGLQQLVSRVASVSSHVNNLAAALAGALEGGAGGEGAEGVSSPSSRLQHAVLSALADCGLRAALRRDQLVAFCQDCRNMLQEAHDKFSQLSELLSVCQGRLATAVRDMN
ncbi:putative ubiquitin-protein ligase BRE1 [Danaus plexippus plexippus]|uniref:Ubiquitin-protein ligase BRE1 n=1 Tax=Danaus plexippus plexippus TaxID=278856 RepID=A0A212EIF0_DANPL|nr:putative ubiquitin-protein ligase BRE1 [Danaus plexippus plexippus]